MAIIMTTSLLTAPSHSHPFPNWCPLIRSHKASNNNYATPLTLGGTNYHPLVILPRTTIRATVDDTESDQLSSTPLLVEHHKHNKQVEESVKVLKDAAKTRKVAANKVLSALSVIEKAKIDPSGFLETLGGNESPGRTWMLIFTAEKQLKGGRYFPLTAVQRFDAAAFRSIIESSIACAIWRQRDILAIWGEDDLKFIPVKAKRIENGVYLGPVGQLTFEGRLSWKKRILAFIFENLRIKVGPLGPLQISLGGKEDREPSTKDPFFIWFYIDDEIAVARGRGGGTAFWCRCQRVHT